jgi:hypothetical protein
MERKTVQYQAVTAEGAQRQYAADSAQAAAAGWVVETVGWEAASPPMLGATYVRIGAPGLPAWQAPRVPASEAGQSRGGGLHALLVATLTVLAVLFALYLVTNNADALGCLFGGC